LTNLARVATIATGAFFIMEHPLIHGLDQLTVEELTAKISELHKKLAIAHRSGNGYLCDQIRMTLNSYTTKQRQKLDEQFRKSAGDEDKFNDKIDIS
jgi:hypothetical protein